MHSNMSILFLFHSDKEVLLTVYSCTLRLRCWLWWVGSRGGLCGSRHIDNRGVCLWCRCLCWGWCDTHGDLAAGVVRIHDETAVSRNVEEQRASKHKEVISHFMFYETKWRNMVTQKLNSTLMRNIKSPYFYHFCGRSNIRDYIYTSPCTGIFRCGHPGTRSRTCIHPARSDRHCTQHRSGHSRLKGNNVIININVIYCITPLYNITEHDFSNALVIALIQYFC